MAGRSAADLETKIDSWVTNEGYVPLGGPLIMGTNFYQAMMSPEIELEIVTNPKPVSRSEKENRGRVVVEPPVEDPVEEPVEDLGDEVVGGSASHNRTVLVQLAVNEAEKDVDVSQYVVSGDVVVVQPYGFVAEQGEIRVSQGEGFHVIGKMKVFTGVNVDAVKVKRGQYSGNNAFTVAIHFLNND